MEQLRIALIGCGGRSRAHQKSFEQMDYVKVVAVADPLEECRKDAAERFGVDPARVYVDHTELLNHESADTIDAAVIAVEPTAHVEMEARLIDMGVPFLVEKPYCINM